MQQSILVIDDEKPVRIMLGDALARIGCEVHGVSSITEARQHMAERAFNAVIIDHVLPDGFGIDLIRELREANPDMVIAVITGAADIPLVVEAMRRGADNFLIKPINFNDLKEFLRKSLELQALRRTSRAHHALGRKSHFEFGCSDAMGSVKELADLAAGSDSAVLITGETGVGKGVLARRIHERSSRGSGSFVEVNCSILHGELLMSELFGHARGAFTSAAQDRQGLLDVADGGTLFLDEIGDMDQPIQAKFLKVVEEKTYRRLGEVRTRRSDFRLICATNKDLAEETARGRFRKDLLYRIQVLPIHIEALKERPEDIPSLTRHFLEEFNYRHGEVHDDIMDVLRDYSWPGNVRELRSVLERAMILAKGDVLSRDHLPGMGSYRDLDVSQAGGELERLEMESINSTLQRFGGDVAKAARKLGISRATIYRRLKKTDKHTN